MKLTVEFLLLLFIITLVSSYNIPNDFKLEKRAKRKSSKTSDSVSTIDTVVLSTPTPDPNNSYFRICSFVNGVENCEEIYEDQVNGGSECTNAVQNECPLNIKYNKDNIKTYCSLYFRREKCDKLYSEGYSSLSACKGKNPQYLQALYENYRSVYFHNKLLCTMDDKGDLCPFTYYSFDRMSGTVGNNTFWKYVHDSCKSKACADTIPYALENEPHLFSVNEMEYLTKASEYLKSEECVSKIGTSSGLSIRYSKININNTMIFITLLLILLL